MLDDKRLIERVESELQAVYRAKQAFNDALDGGESDTLDFNGLLEGASYTFTRSQILFWVERNSYEAEWEHWQRLAINEEHQEAKEWLTQTEQETVFASLVNAIRRQRVAPFIGAGLSKPCGMPLWGEALKQVARAIPGLEETAFNNLINDYKYFEAAQLLYNIDPVVTKSKIRTIFALRNTDSTIQDFDATEIQGPVLLLPELAHGPIITTNVDAIIERVFHKRSESFEGRMYGSQTGQFPRKLIKGDRCLLRAPFKTS